LIEPKKQRHKDKAISLEYKNPIIIDNYEQVKEENYRRGERKTRGRHNHSYNGSYREQREDKRPYN
jgi:hypothetical protein